MRVTKLNSSRIVFVNINKYLIDWNKPSRSKVQFAAKQFLKKYWLNQIVLEEFRIPGSLLTCDFLNLTRKCSIEIDGLFHQTYNKHFHDSSRLNFLNMIKRDHKKDEWLEENGFKAIRIFENEIRNLSLKFLKEKFDFDLV